MFTRMYVAIPERPDVQAILFLDTPYILYINEGCKGIGIIKILPKRIPAYA